MGFLELDGLLIFKSEPFTEMDSGELYEEMKEVAWNIFGIRIVRDKRSMIPDTVETIISDIKEALLYEGYDKRFIDISFGENNLPYLENYFKTMMNMFQDHYYEKKVLSEKTEESSFRDTHHFTRSDRKDTDE